MRLFAAVEMPSALSRALSASVVRLRPAPPEARWPGPERMHLTLAFLGEVAQARAEDAADALEAAAAGCRPFLARLGGPGAFPSWERARVLWAGIERGAAELARLARALAAELGSRGFALEDREFVPHLTLGRLRAPADCRDLEPGLARAISSCAAPFRVAEAALLRSRLSPGGSSHSVLRRAALGAA